MAKSKLDMSNPFDANQFKIAKSTLKLSDIGATLMGGMTKVEARKFLADKAGWSPNRIAKHEYQPGDKVHIDTDNAEWGRVASDAEIIEIQQNGMLVCAETIRANIIVPFEDCNSSSKPACPGHDANTDCEADPANPCAACNAAEDTAAANRKRIHDVLGGNGGSLSGEGSLL